MFAPRYYPPQYFAPRYFPRRGDTPDTNGGGYFTGRYFTKTYFPHRYFPGGQGTAPPVEEGAICAHVSVAAVSSIVSVSAPRAEVNVWEC